jgi:hypothetical protein
MYNWGLGIEHEMRLRFTNKFDISNMDDEYIKIIYKKFGYIPDYLFIESSFLLNMYYKYVDLLLKDYKNRNIKNELNQSTQSNITLYNVLDKLISEKKLYPYDDIRFYDVNNIVETKKFLKYYFNVYIKINFKYLNLIFDFYNQESNSINFLDLYLICNNRKIINRFDLNKIKLHFIKLIDGDYEKEYIKILKKKLKILNFNIIEIDENIIYIKINVNDKNLPIINFKLLEKTLFNIDNNSEQKLFISKFKDNNDIISLLKKITINAIPHIDYSSKTQSIEFKTFDYKNKNYKSMLDDLIKIENTFFNIVNEIPEFTNLIKKYGKITYHHTGSLNKTIEIRSLNKFSEVTKDYAGSFHVWVTIPYYSKDSPEIFINKHINLANRLQLLEPIFASYFTSPDIESIGNNLSHSRSSLRHFLNNHSGYGTSDISLLNGIDKTIIYDYYLSKEDVLNEKKLGVRLKKKIYNNNNLIKNYDGLTQRNATSKNFKFLNNDIYNNNKNFNIDDYLMKVFRNTKIRPLYGLYNETYLPLGADIRTTSMNKLFYPPLESNYKIIYILENSIFNLYYFDKSKNIITKNPKYNMKSYKKFMKEERIGIEFRIFDHFPTHNMIQFLAILAQIVSYTTINYNNIKEKELFINQQYWHDEMASSIINGFEYKLDNKYIKIIEKEFSVNISKNEKKQINGEDFFKNFYEGMDKKLNKVKIYYKLKIDNKIFIFENFNKKVWKYNFFLYLKNNKDKMNNLQNILKINNSTIIKKENILKLLGNNFKYDIDKIYEVLI